MNSNSFISFSDYIKYCALIGIGASSSTFFGLCINSNLPRRDWRDVAFYGSLGVLITSKYLLTY